MWISSKLKKYLLLLFIMTCNYLCRKLSLAMVVDEEDATMVDNCCYFSLMVDESTDIATTQTLIIYIPLVSKGEIITRFLELVQLIGGTADHVLGTLLDVMRTRNLQMEKLFRDGYGWV